MGFDTKIQWADHTWNTWRGCAKPPANADGTGVAPECWNCYAEALAKINPAVLGEWGKEARRAMAKDAYVEMPLEWDAAAARDGVRRRVFFASLADVFEDRDDLVAMRRRSFAIIDRCRNLDFLIPTKRPENVRRLWPDGPSRRRDNVWLGTSVGHPCSLWRVDELRKAAPLAALLFISAEPLVAEVDFRGRLDGISWLILGGESRPKNRTPRPCDIGWIRAAIGAAREAGPVSVFVKQLGGNVEAIDSIDAADYFPGDVRLSQGAIHYYNARVHLADSKGGDPEEWPEALRVREIPTPSPAGVIL